MSEAQAAVIDTGARTYFEKSRAALGRLVRAYPFRLFMLTRFAYLLISWMGLTLLPTLFYHDSERFPTLQPYPMIDGFCRWDCGWMVRILHDGYANNVENAKAFPLLPLLGGALEKIFGIHHIVGFILVANLCGLASFFVVYKLFKELSDEASAQAGLAMFAAFPFAYFQAAAYPESIMVLTSSLAILLALRGRHFSGALVLSIGLLARHLTLSGGAGLLVAQARQRWPSIKNIIFDRRVLALALPWLFLIGFALYLGQVTGDPLAFWTGRNIGWNGEVWYGVRQVLTHIPYRVRPEYYYYMLFALIPLAGVIGLFRKKEWAELAGMGSVLLVVVLSTGAAGMGRYLASIWPAFLPWGVWLARRPALQLPVIGSCFIIQGFYWHLFTHQFRIL